MIWRHVAAAVVILALVAVVEDVRGLRSRLWPPAEEPAPAPVSEFERGSWDFAEPRTKEAGFGPFFNAPTCGSCHSMPSLGGSSAMTVLRVALGDGRGGVTEPAGGPSLGVLTNAEPCQPQRPSGAGVVARRVTTPIFGAGLVEAIPDDTLRALEDPDDGDRDGISGRAATVIDVASGKERVGRFGWKAQQATLLTFVAEAFVNELGVTNHLFPHEVTHGVPAETFKECDHTPDPEDAVDPDVGTSAVERVTTFVQLLPPPVRGAATADSREGEAVFQVTGCARCHVPRLHTGDHPRPELSDKAVEAFSDFLLHDVGGGDGIPQGAAAPNEMRTAPLWGLRFRPVLMHDGGATTVDRAIRLHAGEATRARRTYEALAPEKRARLLAFLGSV